MQELAAQISRSVIWLWRQAGKEEDYRNCVISTQCVRGALARKFGPSDNRMAAVEPLPAIFPGHTAPIIKQCADVGAGLARTFELGSLPAGAARTFLQPAFV